MKSIVLFLALIAWPAIAQVSGGGSWSFDLGGGSTWFFFSSSSSSSTPTTESNQRFMLVGIVIVVMIVAVACCANWIYEQQFDPQEADDRPLPPKSARPDWLKALVDRRGEHTGNFEYAKTSRWYVQHGPRQPFKLRDAAVCPLSSRFEARGSDMYGTFYVYGRLTLVKITFRKTYCNGGDSVFYSGTGDGDGRFSGTWRLINWSTDPEDRGTFDLNLDGEGQFVDLERAARAVFC